MIFSYFQAPTRCRVCTQHNRIRPVPVIAVGPCGKEKRAQRTWIGQPAEQSGYHHGRDDRKNVGVRGARDGNGEDPPKHPIFFTSPLVLD